MSEGGREPKAEAGVGRMVDCSQADDRRLIRLVRERPLLYARNHLPVARYYSQVKRLWQDVAAAMAWSGEYWRVRHVAALCHSVLFYFKF